MHHQLLRSLRHLYLLQGKRFEHQIQLGSSMIHSHNTRLQRGRKHTKQTWSQMRTYNPSKCSLKKSSRLKRGRLESQLKHRKQKRKLRQGPKRAKRASRRAMKSLIQAQNLTHLTLTIYLSMLSRNTKQRSDKSLRNEMRKSSNLNRPVIKPFTRP